MAPWRRPALGSTSWMVFRGVLGSACGIPFDPPEPKETNEKGPNPTLIRDRQVQKGTQRWRSHTPRCCYAIVSSSWRVSPGDGTPGRFLGLVAKKVASFVSPPIPTKCAPKQNMSYNLGIHLRTSMKKCHGLLGLSTRGKDRCTPEAQQTCPPIILNPPQKGNTETGHQDNSQFVCHSMPFLFRLTKKLLDVFTNWKRLNSHPDHLCLRTAFSDRATKLEIRLGRFRRTNTKELQKTTGYRYDSIARVPTATPKHVKTPEPKKTERLPALPGRLKLPMQCPTPSLHTESASLL